MWQMDCNLSVTSATTIGKLKLNTNFVADASMKWQIICHIFSLNVNALCSRCRVADNVKKKLTEGEDDYALADIPTRQSVFSSLSRRIPQLAKASWSNAEEHFQKALQRFKNALSSFWGIIFKNNLIGLIKRKHQFILLR